jgi:arylsulfatase A-like enzyme
VINSSLGRKLTGFNEVRSLMGYHDILGRKTAERITDDFLGWVERSGKDRPFFAFLNYFDAHQPFLPPPAFDTMFASATPRRYDVLEHRPHIGKVKEGRLNLTPADVEREQEAYDATIAYLDQQVSRLLEQLERDGILNNTIVVITADHGEQFMEHELFGHGNSLYRYVTEVPLLVIYPPGMTPGRSVSQPVSIRDIPATIADLTGTGAGNPFPGRSLASALASDSIPGTNLVAALGEVTLAGLPDTFRSVTADGMRAIWMHDSVKVFDFWADSAEKNDLSRTPRGVEAIAKLGAILDSALGRPAGGNLGLQGAAQPR